VARTCTICNHDSVAEIDRELIAGVPYRDIAERHGVGRMAVSRHREAHLSEALAAVVVEDHDRARTLVDRIEALVDEAHAFLSAAKADGNTAQGLAALREMRAALELVGKASGELKDSPQVAVVNVQQSDEWHRIRAAVLASVDPYPEAKAAMVASLRELNA
jgi:uncharacterized protein (DUF1501 family)